MSKHKIRIKLFLRRPLLISVDLIIINIAFLAALWISQLFAGSIFLFPWQVFGLLLVFWLISSALSGAYSLYLASDGSKSIYSLSGALSITVLGTFLLISLLGARDWYPYVLFWILAELGLMVWRFCYAEFFQRPFRRALILGTGWVARELAKAIEETPNSGYELIGFIEDYSPQQGMQIAGFPVLGPSSNLAIIVKKYLISDLIVENDDKNTETISKIEMMLTPLKVQLSSLDIVYEQVTGRVLIDLTKGTWYGLPSPAKESSGAWDFYYFWKRVLDLSISVMGLVLFVPALYMIVMFIRLDSPGPIFYAIESLGKDGKRFRRYKFRTMCTGADQPSPLKVNDVQGPVFRIKNDPRVTRVGKFLRWTGLDELPQLINILRGDMSLVGPRADNSVFATVSEKDIPHYEWRRAVLPGVTGWAQIHHTPGEDSLIGVQHDFYYIKHQSPYLELRILLQSISTTIVGPGFAIDRSPIQADWNRALGTIATKDNAGFAKATIAICNYIAEASRFSIKSDISVGQFHAVVLDTFQTFYGTKLPRIMPTLFLQRLDLLESDLHDMRYILSDHLGLSTHIALIVLFCDDDILEQARRLLDEKMRQIFAYDVIPLGKTDLTRTVLARDPQRIMRRLVLSQVDLVTASPFVTTGFASDVMFFGREAELREITDQVGTNNYAVIGGRRIGKTSIIKHLEQVRLPGAGFRPLYHDCSFTPTQNELVQAVATDKTWFPEPPNCPSASFARIIDALHEEKPIVILLDEADKLIEPDRLAGYPLFSTLRAMANTGRCHFVLSGERALRTELMDPNSPLYNFANEMLIGRLDFRAVEELVTRPMKQLEIELENDVEMVQRIWNFSSGHPNVVQRLCQRLIVQLNERGDRRLGPNDVEGAVANPDFLRKDFLNVYWERATTLERLCSLVMAADGKASTLMAIHKVLGNHGIQITLNQVDDALERLVDLRNILERTVTGYEFAVTAFPEVIAKTSRLEDLIALNRETFQQYGDVEPRSERGGQ